MGLGLAPWVRSGLLKLALPALGLSAAILLHALFNLAAVLFGALAYALLFVVILLYVVLIATWLAFERRTSGKSCAKKWIAGSFPPVSTPSYPPASAGPFTT